MRVLKVKAYQLFANYRKPMSFGFIDTYPLPPLSTIRGWFHTVIEAKEYIPMSMCIQGSPQAVVHDLQTLIKFDRKEREKTHGYPLLEDFGKTLSQTPTYVANLFDVGLTVYLLAEERYLEGFREKLLTKEFPHLGRYEDMVRIDSLEFVELEERGFSFRNPHFIDYGIYLKRDTAERLKVSGINYRLNFKYKLSENGMRYFEKVDVVYVDNAGIKSGSHLFDPENNRIVELIGELPQ